jgi:hypothetical protein
MNYKRKSMIYMIPVSNNYIRYGSLYTIFPAPLQPRENNKILQSISQIYFVICNSCYWCATYFGIDDLESLSASSSSSSSSSHVLACHVCNSHNTELIPISTDESFRIEYSLTRGTEIEFYKSNNVVVR